MSQPPRVVARENALLCERCGYDLTGLDRAGRCPECAQPIADSLPNHRRRSRWDRARGAGRVDAFLRTTLAVWFRPSAFFRHLSVAPVPTRALSFAQVHWLAASVLFALAALAHLSWLYHFDPGGPWLLALLLAAAYLLLLGTTALAVRLTAWEARYRGLRLPRRVVWLGMYYHAAHYPPVALGVAATAILHATLAQRAYAGRLTLPPMFDTWYHYLLAGEVLVAAAYLFYTYWIAMRNLMYANA